jgi:hypothetical protein
MQRFLTTLSILALVLTVVPSVLLYAGVITHDLLKLFMLLGTILWFGASIALRARH